MSARDIAVEAYREALPALTASVAGGLFAGVVLSGMRAELQDVAGLLVLIPALLATRGNVYGSLGARLATGLHQGLVEPHVLNGDRRLQSAVTAAMANGILASLFAAAVAFFILDGLSRPVTPLGTLLAIALIAGVLSGIALSGVVVTVVFAGYRRGHNPDTIVGPVVTTTGDVFGLAFLLLAVRTVLALGGS